MPDVLPYRPLPDEVIATRVVVLLPDCHVDDAIAPVEVLVQEGLCALSVPSGGSLAPADLHAVFGPRVVVGIHDLAGIGDADRAIEQGAAFCLPAQAQAGVQERLADAGVPICPPALTPTEVAAVWRHGASAVQVVPADVFGVRYPKQLRSLVPEAAIVARDADTAHEAAAWLDAGAVAVCAGERLLADALGGGPLGGLRVRCRQLTAVTRR